MTLWSRFLPRTGTNESVDPALDLALTAHSLVPVSGKNRDQRGIGPGSCQQPGPMTPAITLPRPLLLPHSRKTDEGRPEATRSDTTPSGCPTSPLDAPSTPVPSTPTPRRPCCREGEEPGRTYAGIHTRPCTSGDSPPTLRRPPHSPPPCSW